MSYENLILSSYFFNKHNNWKLEALKEDIFSTPFKKELARRINTRLKENKPLEALEIIISESIVNQPQYHQEWLEIISAMPIHSQEALNEIIALVAKKQKQKLIKGLI